MLPKSHRPTYVGYDKGSKSVKYYNTEMRLILISRNYKFLIPSNSSPPKILLIDPGLDSPQLEGEHEGNTYKEHQIEDDSNLDKIQATQSSEQQEVLTRPSRYPYVDYKYLNNPFPDEEETNIILSFTLTPTSGSRVVDNVTPSHSICLCTPC